MRICCRGMRAHVLFVLGLAACPADPVESMGSSSSSSSSTTTSSTTTATTTTATTSTTETTTSTTDMTTETSGADSSSSGPPAGDCDFATEVAQMIEGANDPIDCGSLTFDDDVAAWEAGRMCVRDASLDQAPFVLLWQVDAGGTLQDRAFVDPGMSAPLSYYTDDAAVGTTSITQVACTGTGEPPGKPCDVAVGELCLECLDPGKPSELCD
jgi:hypothetical protein